MNINYFVRISCIYLFFLNEAQKKCSYHFEFTAHSGTVAANNPNEDNLVVFILLINLNGKLLAEACPQQDLSLLNRSTFIGTTPVRPLKILRDTELSFKIKRGIYKSNLYMSPDKFIIFQFFRIKLSFS